MQKGKEMKLPDLDYCDSLYQYESDWQQYVAYCEALAEEQIYEAIYNEQQQIYKETFWLQEGA